MTRIVCWFSCGAASAVATKLSIADNANQYPLVIVYTQVKEEHPDNERFLKDCEKWFGQEIIILKNESYDGSIFNVFEKNKYIVGIHGAPCTKFLKKRVREDFEKPNDIQVFGYTIEEQDRFDRFIDANNIDIAAPLIDNKLTKSDCLAMIKNANIELPEMYKLGYHNNNCIGCVKGGAGYWNKIRIDFPDHFERMAKLERTIGATITKSKGKRVYLDELPIDAGDYPKEPDIECSIFCTMAEENYGGNL
jgi:3'-phosphoadenosine 5'-phosphosulfate sulfotransferase (PAPS reductase)/FAD synthetase